MAKPPTMLELTVDSTEQIRFLLEAWKQVLARAAAADLEMNLLNADACQMVNIAISSVPDPGELVMQFTAPLDILERFLGTIQQEGYQVKERPAIPGMLLRYLLGQPQT